ncbi:hypothetical protein [Acetobacter malorum]|uniref:hypothetical protein n=1 Tax=Acetobacter malorum TaxID=178901 RepID=UPI0039ED7625
MKTHNATSTPAASACQLDAVRSVLFRAVSDALDCSNGEGRRWVRSMNVWVNGQIETDENRSITADDIIRITSAKRGNIVFQIKNGARVRFENSESVVSARRLHAVQGEDKQNDPVTRLGVTLPNLEDLEEFKALSREEKLVVVNALNIRMGMFLSAGFGDDTRRLEIVSSLHPYLKSQIRVAAFNSYGEKH